MFQNKKIPLFYWSEIKFAFKKKENYGDLLSKYLVEKISGKEVKWVQPKKQAWYKWDKTNYLAVGSVIHHASKDSIVWGSGIIDNQQKVVNADFRAVRGPETRKHLLSLGYLCSEDYGDPALLLPKFYKPNIDKTYKIGIIPHYQDTNRIIEIYKNETKILIIDLMTLDVEEVTRKILSCERTISSSLHGMIVSHSYEIPSVWVKFSNKIFGNDIKYKDYLDSVEIPFYKAELIDNIRGILEIENLFVKYVYLPNLGKLIELQNNLMKNCPF